MEQLNVSAPAAQLLHIHQNQRWWLGFGWLPPTTGVDPPEFCLSSDGTSVPLKGDETDRQAFRICVDGSHTDGDGWLYANNFDRISQPREGGRASRRGHDFVRRRLWVQRVPGAPVSPSSSSSSSSSSAAGLSLLYSTYLPSYCVCKQTVNYCKLALMTINFAECKLPYSRYSTV